jgi:4-amino-4-deoxy-L-arabinose transferase-like glycosyltransferase
MLSYWLNSTLGATPAVAWVFVGLGIPWALALLPRSDWRDRALVVGLGFAVGPMLLTAWMFILGTIGAGQEQALLRFDVIFAGTLVMAIIGMGLAWRKRRISEVLPDRQPLASDERLLIVLIIAASVVQWFSTAYWPFMAYDALWVYGYQGRLYTLLGYIPNTIDYYPQFLQLQYTYAQLAVGGVDDHAARAVIPFLNLGSVLAAYILGSKLFSRRVGIFVAAIWALYPHMSEWSRFGDLEIVLTFLFTLSAAFFLRAWLGSEHRRQYALIAGLSFGAAMWTKPTAGAFIWGVVLLLAIELVHVRFDWRAWMPRFEVALITGLACVPLGAAWYVRNILLGYEPITFPTGFWLTLAARSGAEFGWPVLGTLILCAFIRMRYTSSLRIRVLTGLVLMSAGVMPSIITPHRMGIIEWVLLAVGAGVLFVTLWPVIRADDKLRGAAVKVSLALALALPYFMTWFYSYSYHYRLSFPIVPLMILPIGVMIACWIQPERLYGVFKPAYLGVLTLLAIPAITIPLYDVNAGWDWLWTDKLPDDMVRYRSGNDALVWVVEGLQTYLNEHPDEPLVVVAPGIKRLPFFFPLEDIRINETPTHYSQLDGVTYFIDSSPEGVGAYGETGIPELQNQVISGLAQREYSEDSPIRHAWWKDDGIFRYDVYELNLEQRFVNPQMFHDPAEPVIFGDFARFRGHGIGADTFWPGRPVQMALYWEVLQPAPEDYMIYVHLRDADGNVWAAWDGPVTNTEDGRYYSTLVWEPGEFIHDDRLLKLTDPNTPVGEGYGIWFGFYNLQTNERIPVTVEGEPAGDGYRINERIRVLAEEP